MPKVKKQQRHSIDLTMDPEALTAGQASRAAAAGGLGVVDLTQDDETDGAAVPSAGAPTAPAKPAEKTGRKRKAAVADAQAAGAGAATTDGAAEPAAGTKRQKAEKKEKPPKKEKEKRQNAFGRTVPWSAKPSQKVQERMARAMPGSVYTVKVGRHPSCSCPDHAKGNLCKHQLFVMLRVLRLAQDDPLVWQRALLKGEAEEVLSGARSQRNVDVHVHASDAVQRAWRAASGGTPAEQEAAGSQAPMRPLEGAECAICFDELTSGASAAERAVATCELCGNHLHKECFQKWAAATQGNVTCPYCRSAWVMPAAAAGAGFTAAGGYMNLAQHSEAHRNAQSLEELYGATAVWINHNARGGNARHAVRVYDRLR